MSETDATQSSRAGTPSTDGSTSPRARAGADDGTDLSDDHTNSSTIVARTKLGPGSDDSSDDGALLPSRAASSKAKVASSQLVSGGTNSSDDEPNPLARAKRTIAGLGSANMNDDGTNVNDDRTNANDDGTNANDDGTNPPATEASARSGPGSTHLSDDGTNHMARAANTPPKTRPGDDAMSVDVPNALGSGKVQDSVILFSSLILCEYIEKSQFLTLTELQGASRTTGGIFRGRAHGNNPNLADFAKEEDSLIPVIGKVHLYLSSEDSTQWNLATLPRQSFKHPVTNSLANVLGEIGDRHSPVRCEALNYMLII